MRRTSIIGMKVFARRIASLLRQPVFFILMIYGNALVFFGALALYETEAGINPRIHSLLDTVWWAMSTVTTVGYGDVIPITPMGRIIGIVVMILGAALFWSFTALFASALVSNEITEVELEIRNIERSLRRLRPSRHFTSTEITHLIARLESELVELRRLEVTRRT